MSVGLRELLELPEAKQATSNEQVEKLRALFVARMTDLNRSLQVMAGQAGSKDFAALDSQRMKLYEAFQKTSDLIDKGDTGTTKESIKRMLAALESIQAKAADTAGNLSAARDEWLAREDDFDNLVAGIGELEDAGNPKAATLRKLAESIRKLANECDYQQAVSTLDQLQPKFDQIYQQHQQTAGVAPSGPEVPADHAGGKPEQLGGVFPEIVGEQLRSELTQTDSLIAQLEEARLANARKYRKSFIKIRELAQGKAVMEAAAAHSRLREFVDADIAQIKKSRLGGVRMPDGKLGKMGVDIPNAQATAGRAAGPMKAAPQAAPATSFIKGSVGKGGKNDPADVKAVQEALNQRGGAKLNPDGKFGPKTLKAIEEFQKKLGQFKPDGLIEPRRGTARALSGAAPIPPTPPEPKPIAPPVLGKASLDKGAFVWHSTRGILTTNIEELKKGVRAAYGTEHRDLLTAIDKSMLNLGKVVDKLDTRLADALDSAYKASNEKARVTELKKAEAIMKEYLAYVKAEPLIGHMDNNPFGVKTSLQIVITDALNHLSQLLPDPSVANA